MRSLNSYMSKKILYLIVSLFILIGALFVIRLYCTINVFKTPQEKKYDIEYIQVGNEKIWSMENQQRDYDEKSNKKEIYFFQYHKIIVNKPLIFKKLYVNFTFPKDKTYYIYVFKESKRLPRYWMPENNNFMLDVIEMHGDDLYLIFECNDNNYKVIRPEKQEPYTFPYPPF